MPHVVDRRALAAGLLALPLASSFARAQDARLKQGVDAAARDFMAAAGAPGLAIGLVGSRGRDLFYYGMADPAVNAPVDGDTLFEIGSISKTFTVALAALAAAQGALSWNDAPSRHVPEVSGPGIDRLTLRDLATHATGGMPLQLPGGAKTWEQVAAWYRGWSPSAEPGRVRAYANPSIGLLGVATARALRGDFADLVSQMVLKPLGLANTFHALPPGEMKRYAQGLNRDGRPVRLTSAVLATEAYGIRTTASDLLRWIEAQLGTVAAPKVLQDALMATQVGRLRVGAMTQALIWEWYTAPVTKDALLAGNGETIVLRPNEYVPLNPPAPPPAGALINKTGGTGGFGAYVAFAAERKAGLIILANRNHPTAQRIELAQRLRDALGV